MTLPVNEPVYAEVLSDALSEARDEDGDRPFAVKGTQIRHSWSGFCSRAIAYRLTGVEPTEPPDDGALYRFWIGQLLHDGFQSALKNKYGDRCEMEAKVTFGDLSSGHIDAVVNHIVGDDTTKDAVEIKSINGVGYRFAVGASKGGPKGPRWSAVVQGAVNALCADADRMVIVYLPTENISKATIDRYGLDPLLAHRAEWHYTRDEFEPMAKEEIDRWQSIVDTVDAGALPLRYIPDPEVDAVVIDPMRGAFQREDGSYGDTWQCKYCDFQTHCAMDSE